MDSHLFFTVSHRHHHHRTPQQVFKNLFIVTLEIQHAQTNDSNQNVIQKQLPGKLKRHQLKLTTSTKKKRLNR